MDKQDSKKKPVNEKPWGQQQQQQQAPDSNPSSGCVHYKSHNPGWRRRPPIQGPCRACKLQQRLAELDNLAKDPSTPGHWEKERILSWILPTENDPAGVGAAKKGEDSKIGEGGGSKKD